MSALDVVMAYYKASDFDASNPERHRRVAQEAEQELIELRILAGEPYTKKRCLCGADANINDAWCSACFPDTGRS